MKIFPFFRAFVFSCFRDCFTVLSFSFLVLEIRAKHGAHGEAMRPMALSGGWEE
jgi:hypothetical protein